MSGFTIPLTPPPPSRVIHLRRHGSVQISLVDPRHLAPIHSICKTTHRFIFGKRIPKGHFPPKLDALLHQRGNRNDAKYLVKAADGYKVVTREGKGRYALLAAIKNASEENPWATIYSMLQMPGTNPDPFWVIRGNKLTSSDEISRVCGLDHVFRQIEANVPLEHEPRPIFVSVNVGTLMGRMLSGEPSLRVKRTFLEVAAQGGASMFGTPLRLTPDIASFTMLKNSTGQICLDPCANGIVGYRLRKDGKKTFIFVANSADLHKATPDPVHLSSLQIFKLDYANTDPTGLRVTFVAHHSECTEHGMISATMTVQQILNVIEKFFRIHTTQELEEPDYDGLCARAEEHGLCESDAEDEVVQEEEQLSDEETVEGENEEEEEPEEDDTVAAALQRRFASLDLQQQQLLLAQCG